MPQLGETVTEGTIIRWHKQVGEEVAVDDVLFEVSTEKVDTEVPSAHAGVLRAVHVAEGDTVPVGALLAVITETADEPLEEVTTAAPRLTGTRFVHGDRAAGQLLAVHGTDSGVHLVRRDVHEAKSLGPPGLGRGDGGFRGAPLGERLLEIALRNIER